MQDPKNKKYVSTFILKYKRLKLRSLTLLSSALNHKMYKDHLYIWFLKIPQVDSSQFLMARSRPMYQRTSRIHYYSIICFKFAIVCAELYFILCTVVPIINIIMPTKVQSFYFLICLLLIIVLISLLFVHAPLIIIFLSFY